VLLALLVRREQQARRALRERRVRLAQLVRRAQQVEPDRRDRKARRV